MSVSQGRLQQVSQHYDAESRKRSDDSEYNISRLEDEARSELEAQTSHDQDSRIEIRKCRDEALQKEAGYRTIQSEFASQRRHNATPERGHHAPSARVTPPNSRPVSANR